MRSLSIIAAAGVIFTQAGTSPGSANTGAAVLKIGVGARPASLGEAYTAVGGDISAVYWNPAGLAGNDYLDLSATHAVWLSETGYSSVAAGLPLLGGWGAFSIGRLTSGRIVKYDYSGNPAGGDYTARDTLAILAYSAGTSRRSAGVSLKLLDSEIYRYRALAAALDLGVRYEFRNFDAGAAVQNVGFGLKYRDERAALPLRARAGIIYPIRTFLMDYAVHADIVATSRSPEELNLGFSAAHEFDDLSVIIRAGIRTLHSGDGSSVRFSAGFGVDNETVKLDYALMHFGDLGLTHRISVDYRFRRMKYYY